MATFTERLELLVDAKTGGAISEIRKLNASVAQTGTTAQKTGTASGFLQGKLEQMGLSASAASTAIGVGLPIAAAAAGAAVVKFGKDSVQATVQLADGIRLVQQATGTTADTSSRLVAILDDYNISAEAATKGFAKLGINADGAATKLTAHGVEVQKNRDGTLDYIGTLENVADAYAKSTDAGERDKLILDAFGKSGRDLIPILEQGRAGIEKMFANVPRGQILSQEDLDNARRYQLAIDDLQDVMKELKVTIGTVVIPILADMAEALATITRGALEADHALKSITGVGLFEGLGKGLTFGFTAVNKLAGAFGLAHHESNAFADAQKNLAEAQKKVSDLAAEHKTHTEEGRQAQHDLTQATDDYNGVLRRVTGALSDANSQTKTAEDSTGAYTDAINLAANALKRYADNALEVANQQLGLVGAEQNVEEAIKNHTDALNENGAESLQAREAQTHLEQSVLGAASAAVKAAESQAELRGETLTSTDKLNIQRGELEKLKAKFPELEGVVNQYLWTLGMTPESKTTVFYAMTDDASARVAAMQAQFDRLPSVVRTSIFADIFGGVTPSRQHGGPIPGGVNDPYPIIAHGGEYVLSADVVDRIKAGRMSRGAAPPSFTEWGSGSSSNGPIVIEVPVILDGQVLGRSTVEYINRAATRGPGPLLSSSVA